MGPVPKLFISPCCMLVATPLVFSPPGNKTTDDVMRTNTMKDGFENKCPLDVDDALCADETEYIEGIQKGYYI